MLGEPEPIEEPDRPDEEWMWPLAADGRSRLRRLGAGGRYDLRGISFDGGQAYLWYAIDTATGTPVAIKTLRPDGAFGRGRIGARRMIREARIMQSIAGHPNVMRLLDSGPDHLVQPESLGLRPRTDDPFEAHDPWLVMPMTRHRRLARLVRADPLTADEWLWIARGYADGLAHLHRLGAVHRDLSPGNVLLTADGPVITDFGVSWAPRWADDEGVEQTMSTGLTRQAAGRTEDWHAPELFDAPLDERPDRRPASDVFAWGLFVATAAGQRHPWSQTHGNVTLDTGERARMYGGAPPHELTGALATTGSWAALVEAALAPDPAARPSADELVRLLDDERAALAYTPVRRTPARSRAVEPDDEADEAVEVLHAALRERWRADPAWIRVGAGRRLPIGWQVSGAAAPAATDGYDASSRLIELWRQGGGARTVVLGAAGSGKSELLMGVFRTLLGEWTKGEPLPLLVPLASWDPALADLRTWLIDWLHANHGFLDRPAGGPAARTRAAKLLDDRHLVLILDGLDEVLAKAPPRAVVDQLNSFDGPARLLVSSRDGHRATDELFPGGVTVTLHAQELGDVVEYLRRSAPDEQRWDPVVASLPERPDLAEVLRTPLMVMLADAIYNTEETPRPDPRALLDRHGAEALTHHLLGGFVPARYAEAPVEYPAPQAARWLGYLARMVADTGELRWWDLRITSAPTSRALLHSLTLAAVVVWTALSAGVMNTWVFDSITTGVTDAIRITAATLICYAALIRVTGSYPAAVLAVLGAYITGTLSGSYDLAIASGLAAGFSWRPLQLRAYGGALRPAALVAAAAVAADVAVRVLSAFVPLDNALVVGFAAGTFDGFALRWDEDVNGWLATGLAAGLLTWIGIRVTGGGGKPAAAGIWARPEVHGLLAAVVVGAITSWADGARPGVDQPWLIAPADGLAAGLAVWWVSRWARPQTVRWAVRLPAAAALGGLTAGLNVLGYTQRPDIGAPVVRAISEGLTVAVLVLLALGERPARRTLRQIVPPAILVVLAGAVIAVLLTESAGVARGVAAGLAVTLALLFFLTRPDLRSGPGRIDPVEAGIAGLTVAGLLAGFAYALLFGLITGLASRMSTDIAQRKLPSLRISAPWWQTMGGALLGVMAAVTAAANGFALVWLIVIGLAGGVAGAYTFGIRGDDPDNRLAASPTRLFHQDRNVFVRMTAVIALAIGTAVGVRTAAGGQSAAAAVGAAAGVFATYGLTAGLVVAASATRFGVFAIRSAWLATGDELPWRLMRFLDDAHGRTQVLRAAGSAYQFRHELLRAQIADPPD